MMNEAMKNVRLGILLSLLTILFGFGLGGVFGAAEDDIKGKLKSDGLAALEMQYNNDEAAMNKVVSKSWSYMKRAHLHGGAIGTASLVMVILLGFLQSPKGLSKWTAVALGAGGLMYATFWMAAGFRAPSMGGTGVAKESLTWLATPGAAFLLLGVLSVIYQSFTSLWLKKD